MSAAPPSELLPLCSQLMAMPVIDITGICMTLTALMTSHFDGSSKLLHANAGYNPAKFFITNISNQSAVVKEVDSTKTWDLPKRFTSTGWIDTNGRYDVYMTDEPVSRLSIVKASGLIHCLRGNADNPHYFAVVISIEGFDGRVTSELDDRVVSLPPDDAADSPAYFLLKNSSGKDAVIVDVDSPNTRDFPNNTDTPRIARNGRYDIYTNKSPVSGCSVVKADGIISVLRGGGDGGGSIELEIL